MITSEKLITEKHSKAVFFASFEDKYMAMDNLEEKAEPIIHAREERYNAEYFYQILVLRGTLNIILNGNPLEIRMNEMVTIKPGIRIIVKDSRCIYCSLLTSSYIMNDILEHSTMGKDMTMRGFSYTYAHYSQDQVNIFLRDYKRVKREQQRADYPMKEMVLRAYVTALLAKLFSYTTPSNVINQTAQSKQSIIFNNFITLLSQEHKNERAVNYYAQRLNISSKYLSTITQAKTGFSASQVIDKYVVGAIKQMLYSHEYNIKVLSEIFHFPSQSFFGRFFKRVTGLSPNEYIKLNNKTSLNFKNDILLSTPCQK